MNSFLKSHTLLLSLTLCLSTILIFWALTTDRCLEITSKEIEIKASCESRAKKTEIEF